MSKPTQPRAQAIEQVPEVEPFTKAAQVKGRKAKKSKAAETQAPEQSQEPTPTPIEPILAPEPTPAPEPAPEPTPTPTPTPAPTEPMPPLTLESLYTELQSLRYDLYLITQSLAPKRKATSNGKVSILDTKTNAAYRSKNNAYQSLLKSGELKDLVELGAFGEDPAKNTFGWYALNRAFPGRFTEVPAEKA